MINLDDRFTGMLSLVCARIHSCIALFPSGFLCNSIRYYLFSSSFLIQSHLESLSHIKRIYINMLFALVEYCMKCLLLLLMTSISNI